jgi:hypothetical protein
VAAFIGRWSVCTKDSDITKKAAFWNVAAGQVSLKIGLVKLVGCPLCGSAVHDPPFFIIFKVSGITISPGIVV